MPKWLEVGAGAGRWEVYSTSRKLLLAYGRRVFGFGSRSKAIQKLLYMATDHKPLVGILCDRANPRKDALVEL